MTAVEIDNLPPPVSLTERIRTMRPATSLFIKDASHDSIKAMVSRIGKKSRRPKRKYKTSSKDGGVRVWRIA